jgi:hypothetical protein
LAFARRREDLPRPLTDRSPARHRNAGSCNCTFVRLAASLDSSVREAPHQGQWVDSSFRAIVIACPASPNRRPTIPRSPSVSSTWRARLGPRSLALISSASFAGLPSSPRGTLLSLRVAVLVAAGSQLHHEALHRDEDVLGLLRGVLVSRVHCRISPRVSTAVENQATWRRDSGPVRHRVFWTVGIG